MIKRNDKIIITNKKIIEYNEEFVVIDIQEDFVVCIDDNNLIKKFKKSDVTKIIQIPNKLHELFKIYKNKELKKLKFIDEDGNIYSSSDNGKIKIFYAKNSKEFFINYSDICLDLELFVKDIYSIGF